MSFPSSFFQMNKDVDLAFSLVNFYNLQYVVVNRLEINRSTTKLKLYRSRRISHLDVQTFLNESIS